MLAIAGALWLGARRGRLGAELLFTAAEWPRDLALGVGAAALLLGLWFLALRLLPAARALESELASRLGPLPGDEALALALLSAFAEELFFRGALQSAVGLPAATVLFAALHLGPGRRFVLWAAFAALAGLAFGALVAIRGQLASALVAHFAINAVNLLRIARRTPANG